MHPQANDPSVVGLSLPVVIRLANDTLSLESVAPKARQQANRDECARPYEVTETGPTK